MDVDGGPSDNEVQPSELYGEYYYAHDLGIAYERNDHWLTFFGGVAERIVTALDPKTALDVGCAFGFLVEALRDRGVDATGIDVSDYAVAQAAGSAAGHCSVKSALEPIDGTYDLITCVEVVEHLDDLDGRTALRNMTAATDRLLLSSTPDDFAEPTHLNVRPVEHWAEILAEMGFYRDVDFDASFLTPWAGLFVRSDEPPSRIIRDYERSEYTHRRETIDLRRKILEMQQQFASGLDPSGAGGPHGACRAEIERLQSELLTAIDATQGAEAERGALAAQVKILETQLGAAYLSHETYESAIERLGNERVVALEEEAAWLKRELASSQSRLEALEGSTTWRATWWLLAPYRVLRRR